MAKPSFKSHHAALNSAIKSGDLAAAKTHAFNLGNALHKSLQPAAPSAPPIEGGEPDDADGGLSAAPSVAPQPQATPQGVAPMASKPSKGGLGNWMGSAVKHPGALHRSLGVPQGQKIPKAKIAKAANSDNPLLAKRARLAETFARFRGK